MLPQSKGRKSFSMPSANTTPPSMREITSKGKPGLILPQVTSLLVLLDSQASLIKKYASGAQGSIKNLLPVAAMMELAHPVAPVPVVMIMPDEL